MLGVAQPRRGVDPDDPELLRLVEQHEGRLPHMYLDQLRNVTVGIGQLLPTPQSAAVLPFHLGRFGTGPHASYPEIVAAWERVKHAPLGIKRDRIRELGGMEFPNSAIEALFRRRVATFVRELRATFPDYDTYPYEAQLALLDLAFNTGSVTARNWPSLTVAVRRRDWMAAAAQSHRGPPIQKSRNAATFDLFARAAARDSSARRGIVP